MKKELNFKKKSLFTYKSLVFFLGVSILSISSSIAQKLSITDEKFNEHKAAGDKYLADEEYYLAAQEYHKAEKLKPTDHFILFQLAESYRKYQDYDDAENWYRKLCSTPDNTYPLAPFWLAMMEKTNGKYIEAEGTFSAFVKTFQPKNDEDKNKLKEAEFEYKGCVYAIEQLRRPIKQNSLTILPVPVNSKNTDYAPMIFFHDSSIVITSSRADAKGTELNLATGEARSDNFRFEKIGERWVRHHNDDNFDIVNTPKDDGAGELTHDQNKYYYTICDPECAIFVSKKVKGKFTKPLKLNKNINATGYWNAQPTVSPTADTMFFVSKRPGGKGQHDIWMSVNKDKTGANEEWGSAMNLVNINTPYVEITPFWDDHTNTIYFASNGHVGFGGWDIYVAKGVKRDSIVNLGLPFNSNRDDFYFTLGKEKGYMVSNREGGIGHDDIYSFNIHVKESEVGSIPKDSFTDAQSVASVGRIIIGDNQQPISDLPVFLKDETGQIIKEAKTNANGEFRFDNLPPDKNFKITINESDPRIKTQIDYQVEKKPLAAIKPGFDPKSEVEGSGKVINKASKAGVSKVGVVITNDQGKVVKKAKTNSSGEFVAAGLTGSKSYDAKLENPNSKQEITSNFKLENEPISKPILGDTIVANTSTSGTKSTSYNTTNSGATINSTNTGISTNANNTTVSAITNQQTVTTVTNQQVAINTQSEPIVPIETPREEVAKPIEVAVSDGVTEDPTTKKVVSKTKIQKATRLENTGYDTPTKTRPSAYASVSGSKSKIVVDHFKIKSSNTKPSKVFFENVYFDFNSVELSPSAKKAIDNLITYYGDHKEIQIEIKAYSDGFGTPDYNKQLAEQRGKACYDYFIGRGVDQTALLIVPVGELNPVANNGSFAGRQLNRRVEFSTVGAKDPFQPEAMVYIIEPRMTIFSISRKFGMTMNELKEMNGDIDPANLKAYSTLRVKRTPDAVNIAPASIDFIKSGKQEYRFKNMQFIPVDDATQPAQNEKVSDNEYVVQPQETLFSIAKRNGITVDQLMQLNGLTDNSITIGQRLRIK